MKSQKPHRNLLAWQKTMDFTVNVYQATKNFPQEEVYALTSQLRRAAVSAPSNIAERAANRTRQQFSNYLSNAIGSLNEVDTQLELALRLGYVTGTDYDPCTKRSMSALPLHTNYERQSTVSRTAQK